MVKNVTKVILSEYEKKCSHYSTFTKKIEKLVRDLVNEKNLRVHSISSRVKTRGSLQKKLVRSEKGYGELSDIPDISGLRIITFFADDVDLIADMIDKELDVDKELSVDKRELLDPDRFGYLSLHFVVKLSDSRLKLTEYRRFADCHAEIQIRSILQHAWAEIEHDLGYKSKQAVPKGIRRRFSRLAGLLEIADDEFVHIRNNLLKYEQNVPKLVVEAPEEVLIDKASLLWFIRTSSLVRELDQEIASRLEEKVETAVSNLESRLKELEYSEVQNIAELRALLKEKRKTITTFADLWSPIYSKYRGQKVVKGVCLFFLCYVLVGEKKSFKEALEYVKTVKIGPEDERESIAKDIISIYTKAVSG